MKTALTKSSWWAAKCGLVAVALTAGPVSGLEPALDSADRTDSIFIQPMLLASVDAGSVFANAAVAARAVNLQRPLARAEAEARYREGLNLAGQNNMRGALVAFHEAADNGYGLAQRKLGDLYGTGDEDVARDYETSLRWYVQARNQGVEITNKPFTYSGYRR